MNLTIDLVRFDLPRKSYRNRSHESVGKSIFVRTTLFRHQSSQLQRYIGFPTVSILGSHKISSI